MSLLAHAYLNDRLEQSHCGIKGRVRSVQGFKSQDVAKCFCRESGAIRNPPRPCRRHNQIVSVYFRRACFAKAIRLALKIIQNA
jgi:transposase-like protein